MQAFWKQQAWADHRGMHKYQRTVLWESSAQKVSRHGNLVDSLLTALHLEQWEAFPICPVLPGWSADDDDDNDLAGA